MRTLLLLVTLTAFAALAACGGGGHGFSVDAAPLTVMTNTVDPTLVSGDTVDWEIPLGGGCSGSGPFVVEVIDGALPAGVGISDDNGRHHLVGVLLADGEFAFRIKITDTSCTPFATVSADFTWSVAQGAVRIVGCNPPLVPFAEFNDPLKHAGVDALATVVYGTFTNYDLVVAGGVGPYTCALIDDPADPDDGNLPTGLSFAVNSCSLIGTPTQVGPGGRPFLYTIRVTDALGNTSTRKLQHKIDTPPIILASSTLGDGQSGIAYTDALSVVDGVPPISFELLDNLPGDDGDPETANSAFDDYELSPGGAPIIQSWIDPALPFQLTIAGPAGDNARLHSGSGRIDYPAESLDGPDYTAVPMPPEGLAFDRSGIFSGVPRRRGDFRLCVHAFSELVPNERGQHAFTQLALQIAPAAPLVWVPSFTVEGEIPTLQTADGRPTLPEAEVGVPYNPDALSHSGAGLELLASGGVPFDGWGDQPHAADVGAPPTVEQSGKYLWDAQMDADGKGAWGSEPDALGLMSEFGLFGTGTGTAGQTNANSLHRTVRRYIELRVQDHALPLSERTTLTEEFGLAVGPDVVIITQSTRTNSATYSYFGAGTSQSMVWDDHYQRIRKFKASSTTPGVADLDATDMAATHVMPAAADLAAATNPLGTLLSDSGGLDLLRGVVNATGYWDDKHGLNVNGARPGQHGDFNRDGGFYGHMANYYNGGYYVINSGYLYGNWQPNVTCIDIPDAQNVPGGHAPESGVYTNGGRLYNFESATHYGLFIIREDGKIYVPYAAKKSTTYEGFGDGATQVRSAPPVNSMFRVNHMTVSPDGRFAAMKIMKDTRNPYEAASDSRILLVSLTGEKVFDDGAGGSSTYKVVANGSSTTGSGNRLQYASSMALTNNYLYFLIGTKSAASGTATSVTPCYWQAWSGHFIMRYAILGGASSAAKLESATGDSQWTQTQAADTTMQTVFQYHGPNTVAVSAGVGLRASSTSYGYAPYPRYWGSDGMSMHEDSLAPTPFRVSRDGSTVAFFAAEDYHSYYYGTQVYSNYCWVDTGDGARRVTSTRRRHMAGSTRGYTLYDGPWEYGSNAWGRYAGPTPGVEISDDGTQVAFVYNSIQGYIYGSDSYSSAAQRYYRDSIILTSTTDGWATYDERDIAASTFRGTLNSSGQSTSNSNYIKWRFGALAFTEDGTGLVFWAGGGNYYAAQASYSYSSSYVFTGAFFIHKVTDTNKVTTMCSTSEGGFGSAGVSYTASSPRTASAGGGVNATNFGAIHPWGGFISKNRKFMYVVNHGATSSSEGTAQKLIGLNIQSANSGTFAGKANARAFVPANWPQRRGFLVGAPYIYYGRYYPYYYGYGVGCTGHGCQVMAKDTGWVFWGANNQYAGASQSTSTSYAASAYPQYYYGCYHYGGMRISGFNADMGGAVAQLDPTGMSVTGTATSPYEGLDYLEVTRDGKQLLAVTSYGNTSYLYKNAERVAYVTNIDFDTATGTMHSGFNRAVDAGRIEASNGRASEAMAYSLPSKTAYYAYKSGAGNETNMEMVQAVWDPAAKTWDKTVHTSITGRIHVLFATR